MVSRMYETLVLYISNQLLSRVMFNWREKYWKEEKISDKRQPATSWETTVVYTDDPMSGGHFGRNKTHHTVRDHSCQRWCSCVRGSLRAWQNPYESHQKVPLVENEQWHCWVCLKNATSASANPTSPTRSHRRWCLPCIHRLFLWFVGVKWAWT